MLENRQVMKRTFPELFGEQVIMPVDDYPAQLYDTLAALCEDLRLRYPIAHVAGHEHIAPGRKQDPGPGFDWSHLQARLGWPPPCFPDTLQPGTPAA